MIDQKEKKEPGTHPINRHHLDRAARLCRELNFTLFDESVQLSGGRLWMMAARDREPLLLIDDMPGPLSDMGFRGQERRTSNERVTLCELNHDHAEALRSIFPFTQPELIGRERSFGYGDRLGNAGAAHLKAAMECSFRVVLAQQSIRELERTGRKPEEVLDAATWAVFRRGFKEGFGADADHLKTTGQIDRMVDAGFTMFTIDPGDHVQDLPPSIEIEKLKEQFENLPWSELDDQPSDFLLRHLDQTIRLGQDVTLEPREREILGAMVKYGRVIAHAAMMIRHLMEEHGDHPFEVELSVDETDQPTTPFEHYLIASELHRRGLKWVSLAPRFCGDFEKGIDFRGSLDQFNNEYRQHLEIARRFGDYKLSLHSGSDKFSIYREIASIDSRNLHIKTAGTSYLEALRTIAQTDPSLFREILSVSARKFEEARKSYHISADLTDLPDLHKVEDKTLPELLNHDSTRQVLHVAYGEILNPATKSGKRFRDPLMERLKEAESLYEQNLVTHFRRHLEPFENAS